MLIYMDACCYNRPFDDPAIDRNHLEAEAVVAILSHVHQGKWQLASSSVLGDELSTGRDAVRREALLGMLAASRKSLRLGSREVHRAVLLRSLGLRRVDALHVACAESLECDVMLTTDDQLLRRAAVHSSALAIEIRNPLEWLLEQRP